MFDYWINPNGRNEPDNNTTYDKYGIGINSDHKFKFWRSAVQGWNVINWTGSKQLPNQGLVKSLIGDDGYPVLAVNRAKRITKEKSLAYLFNPSIEHDGKESFKNVSGLLTNDSEGYYFFDSTEYMAELDEDKNEVYVYDSPGVYDQNGNNQGQFFLFNYAPSVMESRSTSSSMNHCFGVSITTRFIQLYGGHTNSKEETPTTFHFSGDDDVWIFIDGVPIGDVGGIHDACSIDIDFVSG